ncbi:MAG: hypothetical protein ACK2T3_00985 [Candidatus Promineifilaceae bacterium]
MNEIPKHSVPKSDWLIIAVIGLLVQSIWLIILDQPTYMDAYYYASNGERLATGHGFTEMVIWQYLDDPEGLPAPSHTYWMPLTSILAAAGYLIRADFLGEQLPFWLLAGLLPLLAFWISLQLSDQRWQAWAAALFTATGSFYGVYLSQPSTFAPFAWSGGLCLLMLGLIGAKRFADEGDADDKTLLQRKRWLLWLLAGLFAGFAHLTRADGILLLLIALAVWLLEAISTRKQRAIKGKGDSSASNSNRGHWRSLAALLLGYLGVMGIWYTRNFIVTGRILSPVGMQTALLTTYDDLFAYGRSIHLSSYLDWGLRNIVSSKIESLWVSIQTIVAVPGVIFLTPFILVALVHFFRRPAKRAFLQPTVWYTLLLLFVMSFIFTFPGMRGALLHSSSALWPWFTALAAAGIGIAVDWVSARLPHWEPAKAKVRFSALFVVIALVIGLYVSLMRADNSEEVERLLELKTTLSNESVVMASNAPAIYYHLGLPSLSVPNEATDVVYQAAQRYGVTHLLLDADAPVPLKDLYSGRTTDTRFELIEAFGEFKLYSVLSGAG